MRPVLLAIAAFLSIALYRMISRGGKTYSYNRTQTISLSADGSEHITQEKEKGSITLTNQSVIIDGREYCYAPMKGQEAQAVLEYDNKILHSVRVLLTDGEKQFLIEQAQHSIKVTVKTA